MSRFQVNFMIKDWVQVSVDADDEHAAKEKAEKKLNKMYDKDISCVDGTTIYLGCLNETEIDIS